MTEAEKDTKPAPDWERIELDYRAGVLSLREMAAPYKVTEGAIRKRAKLKGWEKDLRERIDAQVAVLVQKQILSDSTQRVRSEYAKTENDVVGIIAGAIADVQGGHKEASSRALTLGLTLMAELEAQCASPEELEKLGELMRKEDDNGVDKMNDLYRKVISTPSRIDSAKKVAETLKIAIGMQREAWGMDEKKTNNSTPGEISITF